MDLLSWVIGTAFLWIVTYICVNPVAVYIATYRLRKILALDYEKKIDEDLIPDEYFMFSGALIFTVFGFLVGLMFETFFIGLSFRKRDLPGVFALIFASLGGSFLGPSTRSIELGLGFLIGPVIMTIACGAAVMLQKPKIHQRERKTPITEPSEKVLGGFQVGTWGGTIGHGLYFTPNKMVVAKTSSSSVSEANRKFLILLELPAESILKANKKNFEIPYADITQVVIKKRYFAGYKIALLTHKKKYEFKLLRASEDIVKLIRSVLPNKTYLSRSRFREAVLLSEKEEG